MIIITKSGVSIILSTPCMYWHVCNRANYAGNEIELKLRICTGMYVTVPIMQVMK